MGRFLRAYQELKRLATTQVKLPGWLAILLGAFSYIPDWKSRVDFWLDNAKTAAPMLRVAAELMASPYFGLGLIVFGLAYLAFVGPPKLSVPTPRWIPVAAGFFVAIVIAAFAVVLFVTRGEADWWADEAIKAQSKITDMQMKELEELRRNDNAAAAEEPPK